MQVSSEGINVTTKGTGWELFDNVKMGMTDKQQQIAFQRAVQGELERMIREIPGIVSCKVILNLPQRKVFRSESLNPTASVMLVMDGGRMLAPAQVSSIRYMIASSVEGMRPDDVTMTDNYGNLLFREMGKDGMAPMSNHQLEVRSLIERDLREKAESILRPIVGPQNVVAVVTCELDFDQIDRVVESFDSEKAVVVQEKIVDDLNTTNSPNSGGPPGTSSNLVSVAEPEAGMETAPQISSEQKKTSERHFLVPKTVEKIAVKGSRTKKISVAVTVAKRTEGDWNLTEFRKLVANAVGTVETDVEIRELPFQPVAEPLEIPVPMTDRMIHNVEKFTSSPLLRPIAGLALLLVLYRVFRQYFRKSEIEATEMTAGLYGEDIHAITSDQQKANEQLAQSALGSLEDKTSQISPESMATVMQGWLKTDNNF
jgi:flagellar M-ring protein FliF